MITRGFAIAPTCEEADPRHGTRFGYRDDGCKCDACKRAIARNHNLYKMRRAANGGRPLLISKLGAVRRIQALMAIGWPRRELAREAGYQGDAFALLLNGKRTHITIATHQRVVDLFERLSMTPGPSSSTRIRATKKGWPPPLAWDDPDDPGETPDLVPTHRPKTDVDEAVVLRVMAGERLPMTRAERVEVVARLRARGWSLNEIEMRTGIGKPERYVGEVAA